MISVVEPLGGTAQDRCSTRLTPISSNCVKRLLAAALLANHLFSQPLPTPESFFGHPIGADRQLLDWSRVAAYFDALGQASGKLRVLEIGKSAEGRPMIAAFISAPETLRNLERYQEIRASLADPRKPAPSDAGKASADTRRSICAPCACSCPVAFW